MPPEFPPVGERINLLWQRGLRFVARAAIAFALSTAAAMGVGAAVTDNAFVQILVIALLAVALWTPVFFIVLRVDQWLGRRSRRRGSTRCTAPVAANSQDDRVWRQLLAVAPEQSQRLAVLRRSLERSRQALGSAELDPDAHELCVLIDRRLPDLIHHELELLPPDDRDRREQLSALIDLVEHSPAIAVAEALTMEMKRGSKLKCCVAASRRAYQSPRSAMSALGENRPKPLVSEWSKADLNS